MKKVINKFALILFVFTLTREKQSMALEVLEKIFYKNNEVKETKERVRSILENLE